MTRIYDDARYTTEALRLGLAFLYEAGATIWRTLE
jgi:hypothetical protein